MTNGAADLRLAEIVGESGESILILYWKEWIQCRGLTRRPISDPPPNCRPKGKSSYDPGKVEA